MSRWQSAAVAELVGIVPAAGRGTRAGLESSSIPKAMLAVNGKPLLQRNLELLRDAVGIREVLVVTGHRGEVIQEFFGSGRDMGLRIDYIPNANLEKGLAHSIALAGRRVATRKANAMVVLGDECYLGCDHRQFRTFDLDGAIACFGLLHTSVRDRIRSNYSVELSESRIRRIVEKPEILPNDFLGTGSCLVTRELFARLNLRLAQAPTTDWMSFIDDLIQEGEVVRAVDLGGAYVNVNRPDDLSRAEDLARRTEDPLAVSF